MLQSKGLQRVSHDQVTKQQQRTIIKNTEKNSNVSKSGF